MEMKFAVKYWLILILSLTGFLASLSYAEDELIPDETDESITCSCEDSSHPFIDGYEVRDDCFDGPDVVPIDIQPIPIGGSAPAPPPPPPVGIPVARGAAGLSGSRHAVRVTYDLALTSEGVRRYRAILNVDPRAIPMEVYVNGELALVDNFRGAQSTMHGTSLHMSKTISVPIGSGSSVYVVVPLLHAQIATPSGQVGITARNGQARSKRMVLP